MKSANEKKMEAYNQMCVRLGLQPSSEYEAFCGVVSGYDVVVSVPDKRYPCNFTVVTSAEGTMLLDKAMSKEIVKMHKAVKTAKQTGRQIRITMQCRGYKDVADAVYEAVNGLVSYLSSHGLAPCCSNCGQHKQTADYLVGAGSVVQLCPECANNYGSRMALDNQQNAMKKDNVLKSISGRNPWSCRCCRCFPGINHWCNMYHYYRRVGICSGNIRCGNGYLCIERL